MRLEMWSVGFKDVTGILYVVGHNLLYREVRLQHVKADNATLGLVSTLVHYGISMY